jgi:hypothetical protein
MPELLHQIPIARRQHVARPPPPPIIQPEILVPVAKRVARKPMKIIIKTNMHE